MPRFDLAATLQHVRDRITNQRASRAITEAESAGAHTALDMVEEAAREQGCIFSDDIHELTIGSARGG